MAAAAHRLWTLWPQCRWLIGGLSRSLTIPLWRACCNCRGEISHSSPY